ncbi:recombination regulator RecX [Candidatus Ornithobacterium hominis]|uniref:Regulatory protein RecX n=1 Tax=Candidatus Ornithobacterium hominis TaxID=2497989 RepID=A0A383TYC1_9FLAO|nr:regulatory protein RecX [Candidatus Ornithobacterium hominis]CAI9430087.1 Regulatory protein RecX [Candidatus Ornithobacterium hominis]SZD72357.1 recombination regulator RecX [Candidatus Ornithobacterium hominis]
MKPQKSFTVDEIKEKMGHYCAYQDRCHFDVEKKLNEFHLIPEAREAILIYLIQENFLNEERFAHSFVRGKFNQKKWGKLKIKVELKKRSILPRLVEQSLSKEIDADEYYQTAKDLIQKKIQLIQEKNEFRRKMKVVNYMQQKGYESALIFEIYEDLSNNISIG